MNEMAQQSDMIMLKSFLLELFEGSNSLYNNNYNYEDLHHSYPNSHSRRATRLVIKTEDGHVHEDEVIVDDNEDANDAAASKRHLAASTISLASNHSDDSCPCFSANSSFNYDSTSETTLEGDDDDCFHEIFGTTTCRRGSEQQQQLSSSLNNFIIHQITIESDNAKLHEMPLSFEPHVLSRNSQLNASLSSFSKSKSGLRSHMLHRKRRSSPRKKGSRWSSCQQETEKVSSSNSNENNNGGRGVFNNDPFSIMSRVSQQQQQAPPQSPRAAAAVTEPSVLTTHCPPSIPKRQRSLQSLDSNSSDCGYNNDRLHSRTWNAKSSNNGQDMCNLFHNAVFPSRQEWQKPTVQFPNFDAMNTVPSSSRPLRRPVRQPSSELAGSRGSGGEDEQQQQTDFSDLMRGLTLDYLVVDPTTSTATDADLLAACQQPFRRMSKDQPPRQPNGSKGKHHRRHASMF